MDFKLIIKKLNNSLSKSEKEEFDIWYNEKPEHQIYFNNVKKNYSESITDIDLEEGWSQMLLKMDSPKQKMVFWKYAAAILLFASTSYYFLSNNLETSTSNTISHTNCIESGTNKATLTLENGENIFLEKGEKFISDNLESNGEAVVYKSDKNEKQEISYHYLTIPRGGEYHLKLADGTEVWLNSETKIKYPTSFIKGESRKIELVYGEAYFDVFPSTKFEGSKFIVYSQLQEIQVLGTEFNVKAYKDEDHIYTTLVEGKVSINTGKGQKILKPTEQSILNNTTKKITVSKVNVYDQISWKDGVFSFKDKPLKEIAKTLSRWYDVEIVFINKKLEEEQFFGVLKKNQNIEDILLTIKNTNFIKNYDIDNNTKRITIE